MVKVQVGEGHGLDLVRVPAQLGQAVRQCPALYRPDVGIGRVCRYRQRPVAGVDQQRPLPVLDEQAAAAGGEVAGIIEEIRSPAQSPGVDPGNRAAGLTSMAPSGT